MLVVKWTMGYDFKSSRYAVRVLELAINRMVKVDFPVPVRFVIYTFKGNNLREHMRIPDNVEIIEALPKERLVPEYDEFSGVYNNWTNRISIDDFEIWLHNDVVMWSLPDTMYDWFKDGTSLLLLNDDPNDNDVVINSGIIGFPPGLEPHLLLEDLCYFNKLVIKPSEIDIHKFGNLCGSNGTHFCGVNEFTNNHNLSDMLGMYYKWKDEIGDGKDNSITVIVPVRNRKERLINLLNSLQFQIVKPEEVIVVDYGGNDNIKDDVMKRGFTYIFADVRSSFSLARAENIAIKRSKGRYLMSVGADFILSPNFIQKVKELVNINTLLHCHTHCIVNVPNYSSVDQYDNVLKDSYFPRWGVGATGGCQVLHRDVWFDIGGWDEDLVGWGENDPDIRDRATKLLEFNSKLICSYGGVLIHQDHGLDRSFKNSAIIKKNRSIKYDREWDRMAVRNIYGWGEVIFDNKLIMIIDDGVMHKHIRRNDIMMPSLKGLKDNSTFGVLRNDKKDPIYDMIFTKDVIEQNKCLFMNVPGLKYSDDYSRSYFVDTSNNFMNFILGDDINVRLSKKLKNIKMNNGSDNAELIINLRKILRDVNVLVIGLGFIDKFYAMKDNVSYDKLKNNYMIIFEECMKKLLCMQSDNIIFASSYGYNDKFQKNCDGFYLWYDKNKKLESSIERDLYSEIFIQKVRGVFPFYR